MAMRFYGFLRISSGILYIVNSNIQRINNINLPHKNELTSILQREAKREVPLNKITIHYPHFETIIALFSHYGLPTEIFTNNSINIYDVVTLGESLLNQFVDILNEKSLSIKETVLFDNAYDYLSEEDEPKKSDIIFVFGGKTLLRAEKAAELYKKGLGKKILISGGNPIYAKVNNNSEADCYKEVLLQQHIPPNDILLEDKSITVADNVRRSLNLLDERKINFKSIILVTSPYAQRRGWAMFKKYVSDEVKLYRVNSPSGEKITKQKWHRQTHTLKIVLNEFIKMKASVAYNSA